MKDWIAIFKTGTHTDSKGRTRTWTDGDLERMVETYDPVKNEAPVVIGHPKENEPAYGWVEKLKKSGELLLAKFKQVVPEFEEMVRRGRFKKRSIAVYPDGSLRHVGFLGAQPPAVKGLPDVQFKDDEALIIEFGEFAASDEEKQAREARSKKYGIGIKEGGAVTKPGEWKNVPDDQFLDPVNYRYPCPDAAQTRAAASYWGQEDNQKQYTPEERSIINERLDNFRKKFKIGEYRKEGSNMKEKIKSFLSFLGIDTSKVPDDALPEDIPDSLKGNTFSEADLKKAREEAEADGKKKADQEYAEKTRQAAKQARDKEIAGFVEQGIKEGRILPAWADCGLVSFMQGLDAESDIEFSEGGEKKSLLAWFKDFLESFGKSPIFKEMATKARAGNSAEFAEAKQDADLGKSIAAKVNPPEAAAK